MVPLELGETYITPLVPTDTGDMITPGVFVHVPLALRTLLARLLDHILGGLFVLEALLVSFVVLFACLAFMPGDVVAYTVGTLAFFAFEFRAALVVYLA